MGGFFIALIVIGAGGISGFFIEQKSISGNFSTQIIYSAILVISLSSSLAAKSLRQGVCKVLNELRKEGNESIKLISARRMLGQIVGRDVSTLNKSQVLRAAAETASENSVDGVFAPLFWMFIGSTLWSISTNLPGPLAMAWAFKANSTIDSMIGYKEGNLDSLGKTGAILDDLLTWIPCRLVLITLPLISHPWTSFPRLIKNSWADGSLDQSPNSGLSEAIFAYCAEVRMGGTNTYNGNKIDKPFLAKGCPEPNHRSVLNILNLSLKLELTWLLSILLLSLFI